MGVSFSCNAALVFADETAASKMCDTLIMLSEQKGDLRYLKDGHCEGSVGTPIYDIDCDDCVVRFSSSGYGTYDFSELLMPANAFDEFLGWVQMITPCQGDDTWTVISGESLDGDYDFYGMCTPIEQWDEYPQQTDFQTMEENEVVDDEEAYEEAIDTFRYKVIETLEAQFEEAIQSYT